MRPIGPKQNERVQTVVFFFARGPHAVKTQLTLSNWYDCPSPPPAFPPALTATAAAHPPTPPTHSLLILLLSSSPRFVDFPFSSITQLTGGPAITWRKEVRNQRRNPWRPISHPMAQTMGGRFFLGGRRRKLWRKQLETVYSRRPRA